MSRLTRGAELHLFSIGFVAILLALGVVLELST